MKILINIPKIYGGVYNHYWGLHPYWNECVKYNSIGRRTWRKLSGIIWLPWDLLKFSLIIIFWNPDVVLINPSFTFSAIKRDTFFVRVALYFRKKTFVFFHGWNKEETKIDKEKLVKTLNKTSGIIVLAQEFKNLLLKMKVSVPINIVSTKVNDKLLENFMIENRQGEIETLLFLARVEKKKGIYTLVNAFAILKKQHAHLKLRIVGDGTALQEIKDYVEKEKIKDICFTGRLSGEKIVKEFTESDIYILPTHGEGMPASVLEAMAFGLPVITRPVGGLIDFFTEEMGSLLESLEPQDYANEIEKYINSSELTKKISTFNYNFANKNFLASSVAKKTENILKRMIN